ncbi:hypothetical protein BDV41DRAFT_533783 [Aspergillus transmontanensis]|uniref:Uncharacterized protein n=1 Tax=Aspergillus transmontanensis TaxID=1034304 RepID=A0A5N6W1Q1_9EURO|nr:hypothetical protein BDV41DRAFT_533783 [Aspergillus transmontanensis]
MDSVPVANATGGATVFAGIRGFVTFDMSSSAGTATCRRSLSIGLAPLSTGNCLHRIQRLLVISLG